jgi:hypothetical protein
VGRGVIEAEVGFGFHHAPCKKRAALAANKQLAKQFAGDGDRIAQEESAGEARSRAK